MSSEREIRKRAQGRDRTARWRATKQSERATALALAEFRSTLLLNLLKVLHTQVDAADEAGDEDTWFTRLLESKRAGLRKQQTVSPLWQMARQLRDTAPELVYVREQRTGTVVTRNGFHLGDIPISHGAIPGLLKDGPRAPSETNCTQLELEVIDWADAPRERPIAQEVLSVSGEHILTAVHVPWKVVQESLGLQSVADAQQIFRKVILETRSAATIPYKHVSGSSIGRYIELGWACMAGKHRKSVQPFPDGNSSLLPFWKEDNKGRPGLHAAVSEASACLADVMFKLDRTLLDGYNLGSLPWPEFARAITYPLPLPGRRSLHGAQFTSRVRGTWLKSTAVERESATRSSCDLHCDKQVALCPPPLPPTAHPPVTHAHPTHAHPLPTFTCM